MSTTPKHTGRRNSHQTRIRAIRWLLPASALALTCSMNLAAQAVYTASRPVDLQLGAGFALASSSNAQTIPTTVLSLTGYNAYAVFDTREHFGAELNFKQVNAPGSDIYERTYQVGLRYVRHYRNDLLDPYLSISGGRGVYNYHDNVANLAYNLFSGAAGVDTHLSQSFNLRLDFEYQQWLSYPRGDLHPAVLVLGIAYHIPVDCRKASCRR